MRTGEPRQEDAIDMSPIILGSHERPRKAEGVSARGQSIVELALFLPILVLILLIVADFGRVLAATISVSNAAKLAAQYSASVYSPYHGASLSCASSEVQSLVAPEFTWGAISPTVSLTTGAPASSAYTGEQEVSATVGYTFTFITPVLNSLKRAVLSQTASDPVQVSLPLTTTPPEPSEPSPNSVTVQHNQDPITSTQIITDSHGITSTQVTTDTVDIVTWSFVPSLTAAQVSQAYTLTNGTTGTYTGTFVIFQSDPGATTPAPNGCPVAYRPITTTIGPYSYSVDNQGSVTNPNGITNYNYWVGIVPPHPAAYYDAQIGPVTPSS